MTMLLSLVMYAQKGLQMRPIATVQMQQPQLKVEGMARQMRTSKSSRTMRRAELVTPPTTATSETWYTVDGTFYVGTSSGWGDYTSEMPSVQVAISGSDIYIQGLSYWFKDAWIKGSINDGIAVFPFGQFIGEDEYGAEYIVGSLDGSTVSDITFTYDASEGLLYASNQFIIESEKADEIAAYCYWSSPVFSLTEPEQPEVVDIPEGLQAEEYAFSYLDYNGSEGSDYVNVGFDGSDVYVQGLCSYLPDAWVKGTVDGTTVTLAGGQFFGTYGSSYDMFLQKDDVVFNYDATTQTLSLEGVMYIYTGSQIINYYNNPVIKKIVEMAGVPATPTISGVSDESGYGDEVFFSIPNVDRGGNPMSSKKLSFQFFVDVEQEVTPLTFTPQDYKYLEEDMTVIPYGFTEQYDFYKDQIYLNMAHDTWNKIGIQSIYTGGGEENKSDIFWFTIKEYGRSFIDFNSMDVVCSSSDSNAGDITEDRKFEAGSVTLTVSPNENGTANRFWSSIYGPQLRVYGGTLTFQTPADQVITKISFNVSKWNDGNSADTGAFDGSTWTGEANKVVVTIAGNTQINSIEVSTADFVPEPVEAPEGLETASYVFAATSLTNGDEATDSYVAQVEVGFDGDDAYIQGICPDEPSLWVKATKNAEGQYVIPANQYMGSIDIWGIWIFDYYFTAIDAANNMTDIVLTYNADTKQFTTSQTLALNGALTEFDPYITFYDVTITEFVEVAATPADPVLEKVNFDAKYPSIYCDIPNQSTKGELLNSKKLFYTVWIEKNGEQQPYTFTAALYGDDFDEDVTEVPFTHDGYDLYAGGQIIYFEEPLDELITWSKVGIQSIYYGAGEVRKSNIAWMENSMYLPTEITINKEGYATFYSSKYSFVIPEGVKAYVVTEATTDALTYTELEGVIPAGTAVMLEAKKGGTYPVALSTESVKYDGVNLLYGSDVATMTTGPEGSSFYKLAYGHSGTSNAKKLGWYWGAEDGSAFLIEGHRAWLAIPAAASAPVYSVGGTSTGISTTVAAKSANGAFYDLMGRRVITPAKGLYIHNGKKVVVK